MVIGKLRRASEGVKEKPLCWHLLLCQHLLSCSYSTSPIVRPSTKVSPPRHEDSRLVTARFVSHAELQMRTISHGSSQHGNSFTRFISHGSSSQQYMFYIHSTQVQHQEDPKNKQRTRRTALIRSWSSHSIHVLHYYMFSQLINNRFLQV